MAAIATPEFRLQYNGKNITDDITKYLLSITYLDRTEVESDEIEVKVEDVNNKWSNDPWYPEKGAKLTLDIGYQDELVPCGEFEIDEVQFQYSGGGRAVSMKALSAIVTQPLRSKLKRAYENITLEKLAKTIAADAHLSVSGQIDNIQLGRVTQMEETNLALLSRISAEYGYIFNIKSGKLVFTHIGRLQTRKSVDMIGPDRMRDCNIIDATGRTFKVITQKYYDPATGKKIQFDQPAKEGKDKFATESYTQNKQQAELKAQARNAKIINGQVKGSVALHTGTPLLVAGNNVTLVGIGVNSGVYNIESSRHVITKNAGYNTDIEVFKVGNIDKSFY